MAGSAPRKRANSNGNRPMRPVAVDPDDVVTDDYEFTHNGNTYRLPAFATLRSGLIRRIRNMDQADAFYTVLEEVADEDTLAATDEMEMVELSRVMQGWQRHAGVSLGESQRSSA